MMAAVSLAVVLAGVAAVARPVGWTPVCATFDEGSVEWYLFFCFIDTPPKDPRA
jgi:hypothetical protein